jgi:aspartyl-tRNA(Asn)/glutamyl-tRNA(Gln) amidotransferase subunit A
MTGTSHDEQPQMTSDGLLPTTIREAAADLRAGRHTAVGLTAALLERTKSLNPTLGAFVTVTAEHALEAAAAADRDFAAGVDRGPLQGIPLAVKDIIATRDAPTTANSRVLDPAWGAGVDAPVVERLREAGSVIIGKATTSEFACGLPDPDKGFAVPRNPWNIEHSAGGSSSGTGVAIAAGLVLGGLGTDTGGSVRFPAALNGHTGLKVTFGRVPKNGVVPLAYTLDSVGPMARSAEDCALLLEAIAGHHEGDRYCVDIGVPRYSTLLTGNVDGIRIGAPMPYFFDDEGLDDEVRAAVLAAIDVLGDAGAAIEETVVPHAREAKVANTITMGAEAFAYHRDDLATRWSDYGRHTRMTLGRAALFSAADYAQAQRFRSYFMREVAELFESYDVLVTPAWPSPARRIDAMASEDMVVGPSFSGPWNLAGLPAAAVPCGFSTDGLPLSMQIVAKPFAEDIVLLVADAYQRVTDWHLRTPPIARAQQSSLAINS